MINIEYASVTIVTEYVTMYLTIPTQMMTKCDLRFLQITKWKKNLVLELKGVKIVDPFKGCHCTLLLARPLHHQSIFYDMANQYYAQPCSIN